jgi:hypothetical protein
MNKNQRSLRAILYANAAFSSVSGAILILVPGWVANLLGLDNSVPGIVLIGIGVLAFAATVLYFASRDRISPEFALFTTIADSLWVLVSILLLITGWIPFSAQGRWAVGIVAVIVDLFATLEFFQWRALRDVTPSRTTGAGEAGDRYE